MKTLPGTIWINRNRFWWKVRLPGTSKRKAYPLVPPGESIALHKERGRSLAESVAWRMYEDATRQSALHTEPDGLTLDQVCSKFLSWAATYYRHPDGTHTGETYNCELALRELRSRYRDKYINEITYHDILRARDNMVEQGITRQVINQRVGIWKRLFAWALDARLCTAHVKAEVWAINSLKRNRSPAAEGTGQSPVSHKEIKKVLPYLPPILQTMVLIHELCGARPNEICQMKPCLIDRRRNVWVFEPEQHKTQHTGRHRVICLGPRSQGLLKPLLENRDGTEYIFRPRDVHNWRIQQGQRVTRNYSEKNKPKMYYTHRTYQQAIASGIRKAQKAGEHVGGWSPNQLRHTCATRIRKRYGREAARIVLGHSGNTGAVTDTYTSEAIKREELRILFPIMQEIG